MRKLGAAVMVAAVLVTSACGGDSRPSQSDVADGLRKGADSVFGEDNPIKDVPKKVTDCMAKVLEESGISDEGLKAIAEGKKDYKPSSKDEKAITGVAAKVGSCVKDNMDLSDLTK